MAWQYEWWTVKIQDEAGTLTWEFKGKSKESVIKQIQKEVQDTNSEANAMLDVWHRKPRIIKVFWETLTLDRIGYQRIG
ncbi:hypothetical protein [Anaerotignum sp.]